MHLPRGRTLSRTIVDDESITVVCGKDGGNTLNVSGGTEAVWIPLSGSLQINNPDFASAVQAGEMLIAEHAPSCRITGRINSQWIALFGSRHVWRQVLAGMREAPILDAQLLPARHPACRDLQLDAFALAGATTVSSLEGAAIDLVSGIVAMQQPLYDAIARCPGRTYAKRRLVFLRLQRVRNFISSCCDREIDNDTLARMASYSPCHFLRTFNAVYQETPHAYLVTQRLQRARELLLSTDLGVTEVAQTSGFDNRSAFSRLFRQRFGMTAMAMKRGNSRYGIAESKAA